MCILPLTNGALNTPLLPGPSGPILRYWEAAAKILLKNPTKKIVLYIDYEPDRH
jgi:hypothetical protein